MNTPIIFFTGGEPLLHPDLKELCQCVTDKSLLYILTTGDGLTLERAKKLKEYGVFGLGISLTTCDEIIDIEKRQHGKCYQNAINAIKYSVKAGLFTTVIAVIPKNEVNEKKLFNFFAFLEGLGVQEVILKEPIKTGKLLHNPNDEIYYFTENEKKALINLQKKANKKFKKLLISTELLYSSNKSFGCSAGIQHSAINSNGDLTPCDFCPISFGNALEEPLSELWMKMSDTINVPFNDCLQMFIYPELAGQETPLPPEKTYKIIHQYKNETFPNLYRDLQK